MTFHNSCFYTFTVINAIKLAVQFCGHCWGSTHLSFTVSITCPAGQAQRGVHSTLHIGLGSEQVAGQGRGHCRNICPSTGQVNTTKQIL